MFMKNSHLGQQPIIAQRRALQHTFIPLLSFNPMTPLTLPQEPQLVPMPHLPPRAHTQHHLPPHPPSSAPPRLLPLLVQASTHPRRHRWPSIHPLAHESRPSLLKLTIIESTLIGFALHNLPIQHHRLNSPPPPTPRPPHLVRAPNRLPRRPPHFPPVARPARRLARMRNLRRQRRTPDFLRPKSPQNP